VTIHLLFIQNAPGAQVIHLTFYDSSIIVRAGWQALVNGVGNVLFLPPTLPLCGTIVVCLERMVFRREASVIGAVSAKVRRNQYPPKVLRMEEGLRVIRISDLVLFLVYFFC